MTSSIKRAALATTAALAALAHMTPALAAPIILSGNDGKFSRVEGAYKVEASPTPDTLVVMDASVFPPKVVGQVEVHHGTIAPPTSVAVTPDHSLALLAVPNRVDPADRTKTINESFLQVIALGEGKPRLIDQIALPNQPSSVAISKAGDLALTVQRPGELSVFDIRQGKVALRRTQTIGDPASGASAVAITPDGKWALAAYRSENAVGIMPISQGEVGPPAYRIPVGRNPFSLQVAPNGRFAVAGEIASISDNPVDSISVIDLTSAPFKVIAQVEVASNPEGVAVSPDSQWIAVAAMNGTNFATKSPAFNDYGLVTLYRFDNGKVTKAGSAKTGHNTQGVVFSADGRHLYVQNYQEKTIGAYAIGPGGSLTDTGERIPMPGRPVSFVISR